jgi:hypothetical protein
MGSAGLLLLLLLQDEVYCWGDFEPATSANGGQHSINQGSSAGSSAQQVHDEPWRVLGRQTSTAASR